MTIFAAVYREINDADTTGYKRIVHIRITPDAIPGSPVAVPVTPERARTLGRLIALPTKDGEPSVTADPSDYERMLELLLHPQDWAQAKQEANELAMSLSMRPGEPNRIYGIPVSHT